MKMTLRFVILLLLVAPDACLAAEWTSLSKALDEPDIHFVTADPVSPQSLFAATEKAVYMTADGGEHWKRTLSLGSGSPRIRFLRAVSEGVVYAGTDRGLHRSADGGKRWSLLFRAAGEKPNAPLDVIIDPKNSAFLWIATECGLFVLDVRSGTSRRVEAFGRSPVYSLLSRKEVFFAATAKGIHKSVDAGNTWTPVYAALTAEPASTSLEQFSIEEIVFPATASFSSLAYLPGDDAVFAVSKSGLLRGNPASESWGPVNGQSFESKRVNSLAPSASALYVATDKGVYRWDQKEFKEVSEGLAARDVRAVSYQPAGDYLLAATSQGVYKMAHPELRIDVAPKEMPGPDPRDILKRFDSEPTITDIQNAAIRYAEVHPDKIENWRRAASKRALLPTLSVGADLSQDRNVDVDRGGTGDPDRFIMGPEERSLDWSVGMSWNLGDLIWNDDQTSIDTRSRLMVELRDDVLNDVTHLYYERRRLEIEIALSPTTDIALRIEKELKLQELTARIDALTGGYLSHYLNSRPEEPDGKHAG